MTTPPSYYRKNRFDRFEVLISLGLQGKKSFRKSFRIETISFRF
jgi:hypothetical protein